MTPASTHLALDSSIRQSRGIKGSSGRSKAHAHTLDKAGDKTGAELKCGGVAKLPRLRPERVPTDAASL